MIPTESPHIRTALGVLESIEGTVQKGAFAAAEYQTPAARPAEAIMNWLLHGDSGKDDSIYERMSVAHERAFISRAESLVLCAYSKTASMADKQLMGRHSQLMRFLAIGPGFDDHYPHSKAQSLIGASATAKDVLFGENEALAQFITKFVIGQHKKEISAPRKRLSGLASALYEHPSDRDALAKIKCIPGLDKVAQAAIDYFRFNDELWHRASALKVTEQSLPMVHRCLVDACEILDVKTLPRLYISNGSIGAYSNGVDDPYIVLFSAAASLLSYQELLYLIGHELGHIKAGHILYHNLTRWLLDASASTVATIAAVATVGTSSLFLNTTLKPLLSTWYRCSEFTADRAGYLACQNRESVIRVLNKLAGFPTQHYRYIHPRNLVDQAEDFNLFLEANGMERLFGFSTQWDTNHAFPVLRTVELLGWLQNDQGQDYLEMDVLQLEKASHSVGADAQLTALSQEVVNVVGTWTGLHLKVPLHEAKRLIRHAFYGEGSLKGTSLGQILQIELRLGRPSIDTAEYEVIVLASQGIDVVRVILPLKRRAYEQICASHRADYIQNGSKEQNWTLYTVTNN